MCSHLVVLYRADVPLASVISFHSTFAFQLHHVDRLKIMQKSFKSKTNTPRIKRSKHMSERKINSQLTNVSLCDAT